MEVPTSKKSAAWRTETAGRVLMLTITDAGIAALESTAAVSMRTLVGRPTSTKAEAILALLQTKGGTTTIAALMAATGWQAHSIRGFLSGTVGKRLGHTVRSGKADGQDRRYHVEA